MASSETARAFLHVPEIPGPIGFQLFAAHSTDVDVIVGVPFEMERFVFSPDLPPTPTLRVFLAFDTSTFGDLRFVPTRSEIAASVGVFLPLTHPNPLPSQPDVPAGSARTPSVCSRSRTDPNMLSEYQRTGRTLRPDHGSPHQQNTDRTYLRRAARGLRGRAADLSLSGYDDVHRMISFALHNEGPT